MRWLILFWKRFYLNLWNEFCFAQRRRGAEAQRRRGREEERKRDAKILRCVIDFAYALISPHKQSV